MGLFNRQPTEQFDDGHGGMPSAFQQSKEMYLGQQPHAGRDPEVIIKLFGTDDTLSSLLEALTGKVYDKEKDEVITIGTSHFNEEGVKELIPFLRGLINDSITKARLDMAMIDDLNWDAYLRFVAWLGKNRRRFGMNKDSIPMVAKIFSDLHLATLSRAMDGAESDNLLNNTLRYNASDVQQQGNTWNKLFEKRRTRI